VESLNQKSRCMILPVFKRTLIIFIGYLFLFAWVPDSRAEEEQAKIMAIQPGQPLSDLHAE
jgi:hypothetical protein